MHRESTAHLSSRCPLRDRHSQTLDSIKNNGPQIRDTLLGGGYIDPQNAFDCPTSPIKDFDDYSLTYSNQDLVTIRCLLLPAATCRLERHDAFPEPLPSRNARGCCSCACVVSSAAACYLSPHLAHQAADLCKSDMSGSGRQSVGRPHATPKRIASSRDRCFHSAVAMPANMASPEPMGLAARSDGGSISQDC